MDYSGEWLKEGNLVHGKGITVSQNQLFFGYFKDGKPGEGERAYIDFTTHEFGVYFASRARPNGNLLNAGTKYSPDGTTQTGYFDIAQQLLIAGPADQVNRGGILQMGKGMPEGVTCKHI